MTSFADPLRLRVVCDPCKRHGDGHPEPCSSNVVTLPVSSPAAVAVYEPDAFTVAQEERDRIARANDEMGDACRRWTTCGHGDCGWTSPEREYYWQIDRDEDDHQAFGCNHREPAPEPLEVGPDWVWPYPKPHPFRHHMEPLTERVHVYRPDKRGLAYMSSRVPAVVKKNAA